MARKVLNIFLATKMLKKLNLCAYFFLKMNAYGRDFDETIVFDKGWWVVRKVWQNLGKS